MKKIIKLLLVMVMLIPLTIVNAATKTEELVENLKEMVKSFDGTLTYENDTIEIEWVIQDSNYGELSFNHNGNIIEYNSNEITNYKEAEDSTAHAMYALYLIEAALRINGYSEEEVETYFNTEGNELNYEINGIELKSTGESKQYISEDGSSTITSSPFSIKIDVSKANINNSSDEAFTPTTNTIEDVVNFLKSNQEFTTLEYDGKVYLEHDITNDETTITISHTNYIDNYYNVTFNTEDDIITYEDEEITNYYEAERAISHHMFAMQILNTALKMNGYSEEEIEEYTSNEENSFNFTLNGIEYKEIEEAKDYQSEDGKSSITTPRLSFKIDLKRANLNKEEPTYKVERGANQTISTGKELTFKFNIDFAKFQENGKVYIDNNIVDSSNYTAKEGSTIITFKSDYINKLQAKEHNLKVVVDDGAVETSFKIVNNPQTSDNILLYLLIFGLSLIGFIGIGLYIKKNRIKNQG